MKIKKITTLSILITLAIVLSYVDSLIHIMLTPPYFKIGISNIVIIFTMYKIGNKEAWIVSILRLILSSILFSNLITLLYSFTGAIFSLIIMTILKNQFNKITVSIIGAVSHNIGQILVALIILETAELLLYLPFLIIFGILSGLIIGIIANLTIKHINLESRIL